MSILRLGMARLARRNAERRLAVLGCIGLFRFPVKRMLLQKGIVFFLLQPVRRLRALLVPRAHVTRSRFAERLCLGAFESDNFLRHKLFLGILGRSSFLFAFGFAAFVFSQSKEGGYRLPDTGSFTLFLEL